MPATILRRAAAVALAAVASAGGAAPALATTASVGSVVPPDATTKACSAYTWKSAPRILVHVHSFEAGGGGLADEGDMMTAIDQVRNAFNAIGATGASVQPVTQTTGTSFTFGKWVGDSTPTIHVGFTNHIASYTTDSQDADGVTLPKKMSDCSIAEAHILFPDTSVQAWDFGTPFTTPGARFWDADEHDATGASWFRGPFLHELLHAFGFVHTSADYSLMNHRDPAGFPWANRAWYDAMRPLPADVGALRRLYPKSGKVWEVALTNTWYRQPEADEPPDAGHQVPLCLPSTGATLEPRAYGGLCGLDRAGHPGSHVVCAGDTLHVRFTVANSSTLAVGYNEALYFSLDTVWDEHDGYSATTHVVNSLARETSDVRSPAFVVPALAKGVTYHPIVRIVSWGDADGDGLSDADSIRSDWLPLRGDVTGC